MKDIAPKQPETKTTPCMKMTIQVLLDIIKTIGLMPAESGGILGGKDDVITHYRFDHTGSTSNVTYSPDVPVVNKQLSQWNDFLIRLIAFVHSHPGKHNKPSAGDLVYAKQILKGIDDLEQLWLPIVNTVPDTGSFTLTPWVVCRSGNDVELVRGRIEIESNASNDEACEDMVTKLIPTGTPLDSIELRANVINQLLKDAKEEKIKPLSIFERVKEVYDLEQMAKTRIVAVGGGGAAEFLELMARCGIMQFILIDPDIVSETNIATQQTYLKDVGRPKVDCLAERIKAINPLALVIKAKKRIEDLSPQLIQKLVSGPLGTNAPVKTILCGFTDNFFAQAQVNRIALNLGIPSLCAQLYREGRVAEITFAYPGVTPACHRCMLSPRYKHYLEHGYRNDVTSSGTPIFATAMLNAIKGYIALAMIHHGTDHKRWGKMLERIKNRTLVQIRLDPDVSETLSMPTFDKVFEGAKADHLFFGEPVWIPQEPECPETGYPPCPDCDGTGNLRKAIGTIKDTRIQEKEGE